MIPPALAHFLNRKVDAFNQPSFIAADPVSVPHRFTLHQDIEIAAFFAAVFAWGNRATIINKSMELMDRMNGAPYQFCLDPGSRGMAALKGFCHRTFNDTDLYYFVAFLHHHYARHHSLQEAFTRGMQLDDADTTHALSGFHRYFFSLEDAPRRTMKHIATPDRGSTCKRLCMFLRWMVRRDDRGVDFGMWKAISPAQLVCPVDVHVARVGRSLGLISRPQTDWRTALELTEKLRQLDATDPAKYDFALFGLGVEEQY